MCGAPAIVSLLPGFGYVDGRRPVPRQVRAIRGGDGFVDEEYGPLEPWHMFARRQNVRGGSAVLLALQEDVALAFIPCFHSCSGVGALDAVRQLTAAELHQQFFDTDAGTRAVFGLWALRVDSPLRHEDSVAAIGNLPPFPSMPGRLA